MLISKSTYCFNCHLPVWPAVQWYESGGMNKATTTCPSCLAYKKQMQYGTEYVSCDYYKPDGTKIES